MTNFAIKDGTYTGEMKNGLFHGKGTFLSNEMGSYTGDYVDGLFHGRGIRVYPAGERYEGEF